MRNSGCVIAQVVNGKGPKLAEILELSESRTYEILSTDNPYPKTKRLIRALAQIADVTPIKADLDAMFAEILDDTPAITNADLTRELFEGGHSVVADKPIAEQKRELREAMAAAGRKLRELEGGSMRPVSTRTRDEVRELASVKMRIERNGRKK